MSKVFVFVVSIKPLKYYKVFDLEQLGFFFSTYPIIVIVYFFLSIFIRLVMLTVDAVF